MTDQDFLTGSDGLPLRLYRGTVPGEDDIGGQDPVSAHILDVMWFTSCPENAEFFADGEIQCCQVRLEDPIIFGAGAPPPGGPGPYVRGLDDDARSRNDGLLVRDIVDGSHPSDIYAIFPRAGTIAHAVRIVGRKRYDDDGGAHYEGEGWPFHREP